MEVDRIERLSWHYTIYSHNLLGEKDRHIINCVSFFRTPNKMLIEYFLKKKFVVKLASGERMRFKVSIIVIVVLSLEEILFDSIFFLKQK